MTHNKQGKYKWYGELIGVILGFGYFCIGGMYLGNSYIDKLYPEPPLGIYINIAVAVLTGIFAISLLTKLCINILREEEKPPQPSKLPKYKKKTGDIVSYPFKRENLRKTLIALAIVVLALFVYWIAFRPYFVRKSCSQEAQAFATDHPRRGQDRMITYGLKYEVCKSQHGVGD